ncbi:MAG: radical SAM protein [Chloroflexota bacterium]
MDIDIVVVYQPRYPKGHEMNMVPPITGIHLAALTPAPHRARVIHQQLQPVDLDTRAGLVALSFFSGFAGEAYRLADEFRRRGRRVVMGGPHASFWPDEALRHADAVVIGEAESVWAQLIQDAAAGQLQPRYTGQPLPLAGLPTPRYDLLPGGFFVRRVVQATRGCPFFCAFCSVPAVNPGFRTRPVDEVLRDIAYDDFPFWWQRKVVWFWDDNLTARRAYIKELLQAMIPLKKWWLTQASLDIARDPELLDLMRRSGCIGVFLGIESFGEESLRSANKRQNRVDYYKESIAVIHAHGMAVMAGFIAGFDGDTPDSIVEMADRLLEIGVDVPFLSVLTPYKGTALYNELEDQGRLLERGWEFYNGYNVAFEPRDMPAQALLQAHRVLWRRAFSPAHVLRRVLHSAARLRPGALLLSLAMNGFYGLKALRGNIPLEMPLGSPAPQAQPQPAAPDHAPAEERVLRPGPAASATPLAARRRQLTRSG